MTWWRIAKDSNGLTVVDRLGLIWRKSFLQLEEMRPYRQRILSILRRLKICPMCRRNSLFMFTIQDIEGKIVGYQFGRCPSCKGTRVVLDDEPATPDDLLDTLNADIIEHVNFDASKYLHDFEAHQNREPKHKMQIKERNK